MSSVRESVGLIVAAAALIGVAGAVNGAGVAQFSGGATRLASEIQAFAPSQIVLDAGALGPSVSCKVLGNTCTLSSECCSLTCSGGVCINASGPLGCHADSDSCTTGSDCCTGQCSGGTCTPLSSFGTTTCTIDGEPCSSSDACCSQNCADIPGGGKACQANSGCHLFGNLCIGDAVCCGGNGTGIGAGNGEGNVTCSLVAGTNPSVGTCTNPVGCDSEGDKCGGVSGRHDCCGCLSPASQCCKSDSSGAFRCYGGSTASCPTGYDGTAGCCIAAGQICTFSDECCGGTPCLPDGSGVLHCAAAKSTAGGKCTTSGDCSSGLECVTAPGALGGTCMIPDRIFAGGFE